MFEFERDHGRIDGSSFRERGGNRVARLDRVPFNFGSNPTTGGNECAFLLWLDLGAEFRTYFGVTVDGNS